MQRIKRYDGLCGQTGDKRESPFFPHGLPFKVASVVNVIVASLAADFPLTLFGMASGTGILQSVYVYLLSAVSGGMCLLGLLLPWPGFQPFRVKPFRRKVYHDVSFKVDGICRARFLADDEAFLMKGTFHGKDVLVIEDLMQAADGIRMGLRPFA